MTERRIMNERSADLVSKRRQIKSYERRRTMTKWIGIIIIVAIIAIILVNVIPPLFSKLDIVDTTYRPRDVERQYHQIQKMREGEQDKTQKGNFQQFR